ncbi:MAG: hypothetical protein ABIO21_21115 [Pseudomonas sp.]
MRFGSGVGSGLHIAFFGSLFFFVAFGILMADPSRMGTLGRFIWYLGPGLLTLGLMQALGASSAAKIGVMMVAVGYLLLFYLWVHARPQPEALAWLYYWLSYPGVWMAGVMISFFDRRNAAPASRQFLRSVTFQLSGLVANIAIEFALFVWKASAYF